MAGSAGTVPLPVPQIGSRASVLLAMTGRTATETAREPAYGTSGKTTAAASRAAHGSPVTRWPGARISQPVSPRCGPAASTQIPGFPFISLCLPPERGKVPLD